MTPLTVSVFAAMSKVVSALSVSALAMLCATFGTPLMMLGAMPEKLSALPLSVTLWLRNRSSFSAKLPMLFELAMALLFWKSTTAVLLGAGCPGGFGIHVTAFQLPAVRLMKLATFTASVTWLEFALSPAMFVALTTQK